MKEAIRLTNKTAIALRRSALQMRTLYFAAAVILSVLLCALGVFLGFWWLPSVPIAIVLIALMDCAIMTASRSRYLSLLGQAICAEAAAREIRADRSEDRRREQALSDLMRVKEDMQRMGGAPQQTDARPVPAEQADEGAPHRRRRQLQLIRSEQAE